MLYCTPVDYHWNIVYHFNTSMHYGGSKVRMINHWPHKKLPLLLIQLNYLYLLVHQQLMRGELTLRDLAKESCSHTMFKTQISFIRFNSYINTLTVYYVCTAANSSSVCFTCVQHPWGLGLAMLKSTYTQPLVTKLLWLQWIQVINY